LKAVFADTFYWAALTSTNDAAHERALALSRSFAPRQIVTIDEVLCEYLAFFAEAGAHVRQEASRNVGEILDDSCIRVFPQSRQSFIAGLQLYRARSDKAYSLVDCKGITDVLTNDRHFEQEGFRAMFRE